MSKVNLAILDISSFAGYALGAVHFYGKLTLSTSKYILKNKKVDLELVDAHIPKYLGETFELYRDLTEEEAIELDKKDNFGGIYHDNWLNGYKKSNRFESTKELIDAALKEYINRNLKCPFINLYKGHRYKNTKMLTHEEILTLGGK